MDDDLGAMYPPLTEPKPKTVNWPVVAIVVAALGLVCCCLAAFVILAILGPTTGTILSNIVPIITPAP
jgi:drug/metabolite transporter (DMT)-like permease